MDPFGSLCEGLGIGLAVGLVAGATALEGSARGGMTLLAAILGLGLGALSVSIGDGSVGLGLLGGLVGGVCACVVASDVAAGARRRGGGGAGAIGLMLAVLAMFVAAIALLLPVLSLVPFAAIIWLGIARRRRAQRKYEGLRVLR